MLLSSRKLAAPALTTLAAVSGFAGAAGAVDPLDELGQDPCVQNPDWAQCQGDDDDDDGGVDLPDLDWCFSLDPADCTSVEGESEEPDVDEPDDGIPSADPADTVSGSPNFTG
jgi:hypothetical protein